MARVSNTRRKGHIKTRLKRVFDWLRHPFRRSASTRTTPSPDWHTGMRWRRSTAFSKSLKGHEQLSQTATTRLDLHMWSCRTPKAGSQQMATLFQFTALVVRTRNRVGNHPSTTNRTREHGRIDQSPKQQTTKTCQVLSFNRRIGHMYRI
jgi:hypothetical protein